jgi:hypothetical protein
MLPFHQQKKNHCQIGFILSPMEGPWTFCVSSHSSMKRKEIISIISISWGETIVNALDSRFLVHVMDAYA